MNILQTLGDNAALVGYLIGIAYVVLQVLKEIFHIESNNLQTLLFIALNIVLGVGAYYLHFTTDITIQEFIMMILAQIVTGGATYLFLLKPIGNPLIKLAVGMFKK